MTKINLIALNAIQLTVTPGEPGDRSRGIRPIPPVVKTLKPGTLFSVDASEKAFYTEGTKPAARLAKSQAEPPVSREELNRAKAAVGATSESLVTPDDDDEDETEDETEDANEEALARFAAEEEEAAAAAKAAAEKAAADKKAAAAKKAAEKPKAKPGPKAKAASSDAGDDLV